ncbi:CRISPR system precrRNA processing endoribonuclease RAMP protein Cas6 [Aeromonas dhakensis]|uniref:CRISPR system precrRNA processing endoribonuclease RAMP protein Cas6 n=1 Tax=Aeromonas dhakensis TaxID=196024 RepID=UPI00288ED791|nr:CRISPR system precrRNA processing endoribonuclease RAMP protein Cas6 [Aeromonas dhakensis]HDX9007863.1 CRISPR system precrRNA processing endoribonuclease RAMP protein Cas6 [Aeromonas dhakensis]
MSLETLFSLCRRIDLLHLECRVVMDAAGTLDEQAGSLLHGSLGWAMKEAAPRLWQDAYGPLEQGAVRPLSLHPPHPGNQWQQGESLTFGLTLFNTLARDVEGIKSSLQRMGERGWGQQRIGFTLQELTQRTPLGTRLIWSRQAPDHLSAPLATTLEEAILAAAALCSEATPALVQLHACTRLHIKEAGNPVTTAPSALLLGRTLCRRLLALVGPHSEQERLAVQSHLNGLEKISLCWDHTQSDPLSRYSARQRQRHCIEGLRGHWAYQGDVQRLIPWLALGEWIQLGNKTSFGFGAIEWQLACRH